MNRRTLIKFYKGLISSTSGVSLTSPALSSWEKGNKIMSAICEGREANGSFATHCYKTGINMWSGTNIRGPEVHFVGRNRSFYVLDVQMKKKSCNSP
jgi:hypothetical protein